MTSPVVTLGDAAIGRLAREIARNMRPINETLQVFKLSQEEFDRVADDGFFQARLAEEVQLWNASDPMSIQKRIKMKAATLVEDCMMECFGLVTDPHQPMSAKVEMLKWASRVAGVTDVAGAGKADADGAVKITINIGNQKLEIDKDLHPRVIEGDVVDLTPNSA